MLTLSDPGKYAVFPFNKKMTFIWKQHFLLVFYRSKFIFAHS